MNLDISKKRDFKLVRKLGFLSGYLIFTTVWFMMLSITNRLPLEWTYIHMMGVTLGLIGVGAILKRIFQ